MGINFRKRVVFSHDADIQLSEMEFSEMFSEIFRKKTNICTTPGSYVGKKTENSSEKTWLLDDYDLHDNEIKQILNFPVKKDDELKVAIMRYCIHLISSVPSKTNQLIIDEKLKIIKEAVLEGIKEKVLKEIKKSSNKIDDELTDAEYALAETWDGWDDGPSHIRDRTGNSDEECAKLSKIIKDVKKKVYKKVK